MQNVWSSVCIQQVLFSFQISWVMVARLASSGLRDKITTWDQGHGWSGPRGQEGQSSAVSESVGRFLELRWLQEFHVSKVQERGAEEEDLKGERREVVQDH